MTSESRQLLGNIARKLNNAELIAAVFMCHDHIPDAEQLSKVKTAFDLMEVLEQQKVIDVDSNNWQRLVDVLDSKVVKRKDLAKLVLTFGK